MSLLYYSFFIAFKKTIFFLLFRTSVGADTVDSSLQHSQEKKNSKVRQRISRVYKSAMRRKFLRRPSKMGGLDTDSVFGDELEEFGG